MEVKELKETLSVFNPTGLIAIVIPTLGNPHEIRGIVSVGHLDHPGEIMNDPAHPGALDIMCDHWDNPQNTGSISTIEALLAAIDPYPDLMHVRVAVPIDHSDVSHRMLDIVMVGHATGTGAGVQVICENWDGLHQVVKEFPHAVAARLAAPQQEG